VPRKATGKARPALTITLTYADGSWVVGVQHGAKAVGRPTEISAADAVKTVEVLDVPAARDAVEEIVATARAEAEQAAERLRAELAEIEARLAELPEPAEPSAAPRAPRRRT
jgi:hypothetical protein